MMTESEPLKGTPLTKEERDALRCRAKGCSAIQCQLIDDLDAKDAEIERLKALVEVRTNSWMNTCEALTTVKDAMRIAIDRIIRMEETLVWYQNADDSEKMRDCGKRAQDALMEPDKVASRSPESESGIDPK